MAGPYPAASEPRIAEAGEVPLVEYVTPRETLFVRDGMPEGEARLLFFRGQGLSHDVAGRAYLPDAAASRVLVFDSRLYVVQVIGGPSEYEGALGLPLSVAPSAAGGTFVVDVEHADGLVYYGPAGVYSGSASPPVLNPNLASGGSAGLWAARSPYILGFEPTLPGDPLLYRFDPLAGEGVGIAEIEPIETSAWNRLANAGPVAAGADGTGFFAFLLRNELRAYRPDGTLLWRTRRSLDFETPLPAIEAAEGETRIRVRPVTQALAVGPDGQLYALTATDDPAAAGSTPLGLLRGPTDGGRPKDGGGPTDGSDGRDARDATPRPDAPPPRQVATSWRRLEVYDPLSGTLLRASRVPAAWTSFAVDGEGRVYRVDAQRLLRRAPEPSRRPLPDIELEAFSGETVRFDAYRGKALLVNFWASWCEPCKRELPQLERYYGEFDHERVEFLAISAEADKQASRRFAKEFGLSFPLFLGGEEMREVFRFYGLPYTLVADYRGRIVAEFLGFGNPATWRRLTRTLEREIERTAPSRRDSTPTHGPAHGTRHGH